MDEQHPAGAPRLSSGSRSVRRALDIFELMMQRSEPVSMADLIRSLKIPKSTAYELIHTLLDAGYVSPAGPNGRLFLGRKLFELGMSYRSQVDLLEDGSKIVEELRDITGETVQLSVFDHDEMLVLLKQEGRQSLRIISQVGSRVPVNWAASGRLLVSDMSDDALRELLTRTVRPSPSNRAKVDINEIIGEIRAFRTQGYGTEVNEANEHAGCVAAPIIDATGKCVAAISVVVPAPRMAENNRDRLIAAVRASAQKLSLRLGGNSTLT